MLEYISRYKNPMEDEFNEDFLNSSFDIPITEYVKMVMKETEQIDNIEILKIEWVPDQDDVDINEHLININFKKKDLSYTIPKYKYVLNSHYSEMIFTIRISTNLNERVIRKKILIPEIDENGFYLINDKKFKAIWQLVEASTYNRRGSTTLKSRMPITIFYSKGRRFVDHGGEEFMLPSYSYALETSQKNRGPSASKKRHTRFINPIMVYAAKMGLYKTISFFGMYGITSIVDQINDNDTIDYYYFPLNHLYVKVDKYLFNIPFVKAFTAMLISLQNKDFPVTMNDLENKDYWVCRIGYVGSVKSKSIITYLEKGYTTLLMIERLFNEITKNTLRVPEVYKIDIYRIMRWLIFNFDAIKQKSNLDMAGKRIRKNEYIVMASLGKKIGENINKVIERKSKSINNTITTLLEVFNFPSDIILTSMRNLSDVIKSDELVNDMTFLQDINFTAKGPNSLGEKSSKVVASKYRMLHPSMVGIVDLNCSSNNDPGRSGTSFTPFIQLYDGFYFTPNPEPSEGQWFFEEKVNQYYDDPNNPSKIINISILTNSKEEYDEIATELDQLIYPELKYEKIEIVEIEPTPPPEPIAMTSGKMIEGDATSDATSSGEKTTETKGNASDST